MFRSKIVHRARARKRSAGFSLIEVLIATLLFAIAAQALVSIVVNSLTAINSLQKDTTRESEIRYLMRELMRIEDKDILEDGGSITMPSEQDWEWSAEHSPTDVTDLHKVEFTLEPRSSNGASPPGETLVLYLLRPWLSEPLDRDRLLDAKRIELEREAFRAQ